MSLRDTLIKIASSYATATTENMAGHPVARLVRHELADQIRKLLATDGSDLIVKASAGNGNWASVPWAATFDSAVTISATRGYYPVYLFDLDRMQLFLSLNQGTTTVREEFGSQAPLILATRADLMRQRVADFQSILPVTNITLGDGRLGQDYAAGHALGIAYDTRNLPSDAGLADNLRDMMRCYEALTYRGGLDFDAGGSREGSAATAVEEQRRYRMHKRVERNPKAARLAKDHHGVRCQGCRMTFADHYGPLGEDFIEVHHLKPIGSLREGQKVSYSIANDFSVLCANCHRMIHRLEDPSDLEALRKAVIENATDQ